MRVDSLWIYPIKGCRGQALDAVDVTTEGFDGDRQFVLTDSGVPQSQKSLPALKDLSATWQAGQLTLSFKGGNPFQVPAESHRQKEPMPLIGRTVGVIDLGEPVAQWLSEAFGKRLRLVKAAAGEAISIPLPVFARLEGTVQSKTVDVAPLLLANQASLDDLNQRLEAPVPMDRFRANIVVSGLAAYAEDALDILRLGEVSFDAVTACERCAVTTFDQAPDGASDVASKEPLRTLSRYRRRENGYAGGVMFGTYIAPLKVGRIHVGDYAG
jgi:uncharacterized protein